MIITIEQLCGKTNEWKTIEQLHGKANEWLSKKKYIRFHYEAGMTRA